jgi:hypothetical protein
MDAYLSNTYAPTHKLRFFSMSHRTLLILFFVFFQQSAGTVSEDSSIEETNTGDPTTPPSEIPPEPARCTRVEREVWIQNDEFTRHYLEASTKAWGGSESTTEALHAIYSESISKPCLQCLGDTTQCGRDKCLFECLRDQKSPECDACISLNCIPTLLSCTGAESTAELPNRVSTSITTPAPVSAARTRRVTTSTSVSYSFEKRSDDSAVRAETRIIARSTDCKAWLVLLVALTSIGIGFINAYLPSS